MTEDDDVDLVIEAEEVETPVEPAKPQIFDQKETGEEKETGTDLQTVSSALQKSQEGDEEDDPSKGRMGERMVHMGLISDDQLNVALQEKKISGKMLGEILVDLGFIEERCVVSLFGGNIRFRCI